MEFGANGKTVITRRSRGIHAAWHFWHAASFGGVSGLRKSWFMRHSPLNAALCNKESPAKWK